MARIKYTITATLDIRNYDFDASSDEELLEKIKEELGPEDLIEDFGNKKDDKITIELVK